MRGGMSAPGGIMALHLGLVTGWGYGALPDIPDHGAWRLANNTKADPGEIGAAFFDALADIVRVERPAVIIITAPLTEAHDQDSALAAVTVIGLTMRCRVYAYRRSLPVTVVGADDF